MKIKVRTFGHLTAHIGKETVIELPPDAKIENVLSKLKEKTENIDKESLSRYDHFEPELTILVNGQNIQALNSLQTPLKDGDILVLLPSVQGG